ncbi:MAG: RseA family anti-sigma factor [Gammaproteobacteria bacterium]|nr:RseA family anti-sigma factor [Gammaproteobacteria bacterium]
MLVDNELEPWELKETLHELTQDAELLARWRNYHLIGEAMRGQLASPVCPDFSARMAQALEAEPIHFPSRKSSSASPAVPPSRTRTAVGFALAASLSAVAVVGVMEMGRSGAAVPGAAQVAMDAPVPVQAPAVVYTFTANVSALPERVPASGTLASVERAPGVHTVAASRDLPLANDLTDYLMNYPRHAANYDKEDTLSYLRLVGVGE